MSSPTAPNAPAAPGLDTRRRRFLTHAAFGIGGAAGIATAILAGQSALRGPGINPPLGINGAHYVTFARSEATSSWHNDKAGLPMRVEDFPGPGRGAMGRIEFLEIDVIVLLLDSAYVDPRMRGIELPCLAAYNAKCTHLGCRTLWRTKEEANELASPFVSAEHDVIVDPCHMCTFDPYNSGAVLFGPPRRPLEQLRMGVKDGIVQVTFNNYTYGGSTPQV